MKFSFIFLFFIILILFTINTTTAEIILPDEIYGEMYNYSKIGSEKMFIIDTAGVYHNLTNLTTGSCNGFIFSNQIEEQGGSILTAEFNGTYRLSLTMSFESVNVGGIYGIIIVKNHNRTQSRDCYSRRTASTSVGNAGASCIMNLTKGDNVSIQVENENTNRNILIHSLNVNVNKINESQELYQIQTYIFLFMILLSVVLIVMGYGLEKEYLIFLGGILLIIVGIMILVLGIQEITSTLLKSALFIICVGMGFYFGVISYFKIFKEGSNNDNTN